MRVCPVLLGVLFVSNTIFGQYTITEIPCEGEMGLFGGLNDRGAVLFECFVESNDPSFPTAILPFLYTKGDIHDLGFRSVGLDVQPVGINKHQDVIANRIVPIDLRGYLWSKGEIKDLGTFGGSWSLARGINDYGDVVGVAALPDEVGHAFIYRGGNKRDLGVFGGTRSEAMGINNRGQIIINRTYQTNGDEVTLPAILTDGALEEIGTLGGRYAVGLAINSLGHVVGASTQSEGEDVHAFIYRHGQIEDLSGDETGSYGLSINDQDQVIGSWHKYFDGEETFGGFLYKDGERINIADLVPANSGWEIAGAEAINNLGQIAGIGYHNGLRRAYLMTPVKVTGK